MKRDLLLENDIDISLLFIVAHYPEIVIRQKSARSHFFVMIHADLEFEVKSDLTFR
jgi:hypothetical protein